MRESRWQFLFQMLGLIAVVGSMVALLVELRQTQAALAASTYQERAHAAMDHNFALAADEHLIQLLARFEGNIESVDSLSPEERLRLQLFFTNLRIDKDNEFYQYQRGFLDEEYFEHQLKPSVRGSAVGWRALGVREPRPSFRAFVDEVLAEPAAARGSS